LPIGCNSIRMSTDNPKACRLSELRLGAAKSKNWDALLASGPGWGSTPRTGAFRPRPHPGLSTRSIANPNGTRGSRPSVVQREIRQALVRTPWHCVRMVLVKEEIAGPRRHGSRREQSVPGERLRPRNPGRAFAIFAVHGGTAICSGHLPLQDAPIRRRILRIRVPRDHGR
jgi:hypothetical protein